MAQPKAPGFIPAVFDPLDPSALAILSPAQAQILALNGDRSYYAHGCGFRDAPRSQWDAQRQYEAQVLAEIEGNPTPAWQAAAVSLALASTAAPLADNAPPGSIGSFAVARSVALNFENFQRQGQQDLQTLNLLTPERTFGLSGSQALEIQLAGQGTVNSV